MQAPLPHLVYRPLHSTYPLRYKRSMQFGTRQPRPSVCLPHMTVTLHLESSPSLLTVCHYPTICNTCLSWIHCLSRCRHVMRPPLTCYCQRTLLQSEWRQRGFAGLVCWRPAVSTSNSSAECFASACCSSPIHRTVSIACSVYPRETTFASSWMLASPTATS